MPDEPSAEERIERLKQRILAEIEVVRDPWTLAHALLGLGQEAKIGGVLVGEIMQRDSMKIDEQGRPYFELEGAGATLGEQHPHLVLKNFAELGYDRELCRQLGRRALETFRPPQNPDEWNDVAWLLDALPRLDLVQPDDSIGSSGWTGRRLAGEALRTLEEADRVVEQALKVGTEHFVRPSAEAGVGAGTYYYTCGGQHLLQALITCAEFGWLPPGGMQRVEKRLRVFWQRVRAELDFRRREYTRAVRAGANREYALELRSMFSLKLVGHGLEVLARAQRAELLTSQVAAEMGRFLEAHLFKILENLDRLDSERVLFASLRGRAPLRWQLWFGDSCHALRGYQLLN